MYDYLLVNVDELWLKGKNRPLYFNTLKSHVDAVISAHHKEAFASNNQNQRLVVKSDTAFSNELIEALASVPGIFSINPSRRIKKDMEAMGKAACEEILSYSKKEFTFKIQSKRTDKTFPIKSMEITPAIGGVVLKEFDDSDRKITVDVRNPEVILDFKILPSGAYLSSKTIFGTGGLPVGPSGHIITMISGGFDSPVASYHMSKRGCKQTFIFFYAYPFVGEEVKDKIFDIVKILSKFQKGCDLYIVPFGPVQNKIAKTCKDSYRTILFRRFMVETANLLADKVGADALLTGDALGQVSSQTLLNMALMDRASQRMILRPLVGTNKREIISTAREIGTHDTSVIPHDDACAMFAPKHPVIKPDNVYWDIYEKKNDFSEEIAKALNESEIYHFDLCGEQTLVN